MQARVGRSARQRFVPQNAAALWIDDRLEERLNACVLDDVGELSGMIGRARTRAQRRRGAHERRALHGGQT